MKIKNSRLLLVGPWMGKRLPISGQAISFEHLIQFLTLYNRHHIDVLNTFTPGGTIKKSLHSLCVGAQFLFLLAFRKPRAIYVTFSQSKRGLLRDVFFVSLAHLFSIPIIGHLKGGHYHHFYKSCNPLQRSLSRYVCSHFASIIVLSKRLTHLFDFLPLPTRPPIRVIHNTSPEQENHQTRPKIIGIDRPIHLLFLSNLIPSKGYFTLLKAIKTLTQEYRLPVIGHFAGAFQNDPGNTHPLSKQRKAFFNYIDNHQLHQHIMHHSEVTGIAKLELLQKAHFHVLPTAYIYEGQPVSIIEALSFGNVILSTPYRGIQDMLTHGENGYFISPDDPTDIVQSVLKLAHDPALFESMSRKSRLLYNAHFSKEEHFAQLVSLMEQTATNASTSSPQSAEIQQTLKLLDAQLRQFDV